MGNGAASCRTDLGSMGIAILPIVWETRMSSGWRSGSSSILSIFGDTLSLIGPASPVVNGASSIGCGVSSVTEGSSRRSFSGVVGSTLAWRVSSCGAPFSCGPIGFAASEILRSGAGGVGTEGLMGTGRNNDRRRCVPGIGSDGTRLSLGRVDQLGLWPMVENGLVR
jgi:hypothetical protein